jgi:hypothetical protein
VRRTVRTTIQHGDFDGAKLGQSILVDRVAVDCLGFQHEGREGHEEEESLLFSISYRRRYLRLLRVLRGLRVKIEAARPAEGGS